MSAAGCAMLCLAGAAYVYVRWQLDRLSQRGGGYRRLLGFDSGLPGPAPPLGLLLTEGFPTPGVPGRSGSSRALRFATLVDRPFVGLFRHLGPRAGLFVEGAILAIVLSVVGPMHTMEAPAFTWLHRIGTGVLLFALLGSLVHTTVLWEETRRLLHRLAHSPLSGSFNEIVELKLDWRPRPSAPRREELAILMAAADELEPSGPGYREWLGQETGARLRLLHSPAFLGVWRHLEQYVPALARGAADPPGSPWAGKAGAALALLLAFTIRDLLHRIVSGFAAVNLGLTLVLGAHLLYGFQGRTGVLIVDGVAIALASLLALRALVQMERDAILSRLWNGAPGRLAGR